MIRIPVQQQPGQGTQSSNPNWLSSHLNMIYRLLHVHVDHAHVTSAPAPRPQTTSCTYLIVWARCCFTFCTSCNLTVSDSWFWPFHSIEKHRFEVEVSIKRCTIKASSWDSQPNLHLSSTCINLPWTLLGSHPSPLTMDNIVRGELSML